MKHPGKGDPRSGGAASLSVSVSSGMSDSGPRRRETQRTNFAPGGDAFRMDVDRKRRDR
jgi:hypothetical protein